MLIEVTTLTLAPGVDRQAFADADHRLQEELNSSRGFVRRTTAEGDSGWVVITMWWDAESADASRKRLAGGDAAAGFNALVADVELCRYTDLGG